jgi:hypothetical protein
MLPARVDPDYRPSRGISPGYRAALLAVGLASWGAGGAASFISSNGAGAASLVVVGAFCGVVALIGRWPSRISMSGNEMTWEDVRETVDSQIEVVQASGEDSSVLYELRYLRERLDYLQRTGSVASHPAEVYDEEVTAAVTRLLPGAELSAQVNRSRSRADFTMDYRGYRVLIETKWRANSQEPFAGRTLPQLLGRLDKDAKLLVVVNASPSGVSVAQRAVADALGARGRVVGWRDVRDDPRLSAALSALLDSEVEPA